MRVFKMKAIKSKFDFHIKFKHKFKFDLLDDDSYTRFFLILGCVSFWGWSLFITPFSGSDVVDFGRQYVALVGVLIALFFTRRWIFLGSLLGYLYLISHYFYLVYLNYNNPHKIEFLSGLNMILCLCNLVFVRRYQLMVFYIYSFLVALVLFYFIEKSLYFPIMSLTIFASYLSAIGASVRIHLISANKKKNEENLHLQAGIMQSSKMASLGEMAGGIAHEINNPIQIIVGYTTQLLKADQGNTKLQKISDNAFRIAKIVESVKTLARGKSIALIEDPKPLTEIINGALNLCRQKIEHRNIKIQMIGHGNFLVYGEPSEIMQIFINLLNNAYEAIERSCQDLNIEQSITLIIKSNEGHIECAITDSSPAMEETVVQRLFQPFFTTKPIGQGQGLGLLTSRRLAEKNGGTLVFHEPSKEFILRLKEASPDQHKGPRSSAA